MAACSSRTAVVWNEVVEVRDREGDHGAVREGHRHAMGGPVPPEIDALRLRDGQRLADEDAVAVLGPARPAADRPVVTRPGRAEQPVLLERIHALLEAEEVRLERSHVGEEERQALVPAVGQIAQVQRRDVQLVHGQGSSGTRGRANEKVEPSPSVESTQIRPPCCSTTCRAIDRPRPVPPGVSPRTRARSTL